MLADARQLFGHIGCTSARMREILVPQGFSCADEISGRVIRAHERKGSLRVSSSETVRTARMADVRAVHHSLSGVAVFSVVL